MKLEPETETRSIGINCDVDLIEALDEMRTVMVENGVVPSRSELARSLLWAGIAIVRSRNPQVGKLLKAAADAEADAEAAVAVPT